MLWFGNCRFERRDQIVRTGSNHSSGLPPKAFANTRIARLAPRRVAVRRRGGLRAVRRRASTATTRVTFMMRGLSRGGRYVVFRG